MLNINLQAQKSPNIVQYLGFFFFKGLAYKAMNLTWPQQQVRLELLEQPQQLELQ